MNTLNKILRRTVTFHRRNFCTENNEKYLGEGKLLRELCSKIRFSGPITVAEYMREVLTNPIHGFYMEKTVLGSKGHFITSPDISQMFGECVGAWILNEWMKMGCPAEFQLVELGPGRGTLTSDVLRTLSKLEPGCLEGASVHLVEVSSKMQQLQKDTLCGMGSTRDVCLQGPPVSWYDHIAEVPRQFSIFIAHEFLDALAVNKFQKRKGEWREVLVDVGEKEEEQLRFIISRHSTPACVLLQQPDVADCLQGRDSVETSPSAWNIIRLIEQRIVEDGGLALIADYGHQGEDGDTLRAFARHKQVDPLHLPGSADITADVDFSILRSQISADCSWFGPVTQSQFLESCGINARFSQLLFSTPDSDKQRLLWDSLLTLTSPQKMGHRFKFVSLFPSSMRTIHTKYPPVGFETLPE